MPRAPAAAGLRTVGSNFEDSIPAKLAAAADGSTIEVNRKTAYTVNHFSPESAPNSAPSVSDYDDAPWKLEALHGVSWAHVTNAQGRFTDEVISQTYGAGKYRSFPLNDNGHPIHKLQQIHSIFGETTPEPADDDSRDSFYGGQPMPMPVNSDPMAMMMSMMQQFNHAQSMADQRRQDREDAARDRAEQDRRDSDQRAQDRRDQELQDQREQRRLDAIAEKERQDRADERAKDAAIAAQRLEDERVRREERAAEIAAISTNATAQCNHELQLKMMELQATRAPVSPPPDPNNNPLMLKLMDAMLESKKPPAQIVNNPTFVEQLTGLKRLQADVADIFPQREDPPEKPMQEVLLEALPDITNALVAMRGGQPMDPLAALRQNPAEVAKRAVAEFKRNPALFTQFTAALDAEATAQNFLPPGETPPPEQ